MATDGTTLPPGTGSARFEDAGEPSRAEVQQRISALYDRAESDTGTFNATRAMKNGRRRTVTSVANSGRRAADPSLEAVARQWFDVARSRIGPTAPAALPADRQPGRPAQPPRPQRPAGSDAVRELEAAGSRLELEAGERRVPEPTGRAVAALPAAPAPRQEEPKALLPASPSAPAALPAPASATAAPRSGLRNTKEQIRRKLTVAREVLARGVPQPVPSLPAIESRPVWRTWDTGELPAYRPTTTDTWPGQSAGPGADVSGPTGAGNPATAAGTGLPAAARGALTPEPVLRPPVSGFPAPETGLLAASYGLLAPSAGLPAPEAAPATPEFTLPAFELTADVTAAPHIPADVTAGYGLPAPSAGLPAPHITLPASEFTLPAPEPAAAAANIAAPVPADVTAGYGLPASTGLPAPHITLPAPEFTLPVPEFAAPAQAPVGATSYASGPAYLGKADKALAFARAQIGRPCVWGATGPESYDCSSLTQAAWKAAGVTLPRASVDQARAFTRVGLDDLQPGDLVFFHDDLSHTGLCTGNGMMIHAPGPGASIREESVHSLGEGALRGAVRPV
ncbi:C40 family peptidase [Streptomyces sp. NPDC014995]|uniref:C40 family peptidase n=1 Tax=Streptomyces sp. NPDC014995 TaxID=3364936 RepID=UPI0037004F37